MPSRRERASGDSQGAARKQPLRSRPPSTLCWTKRKMKLVDSRIQWESEREQRCLGCGFRVRRERCLNLHAIFPTLVNTATLLRYPPPPLFPHFVSASLLLTFASSVSKGEKPASMVKRTAAHDHTSAALPSYLDPSATLATPRTWTGCRTQGLLRTARESGPRTGGGVDECVGLQTFNWAIMTKDRNARCRSPTFLY